MWINVYQDGLTSEHETQVEAFDAPAILMYTFHRGPIEIQKIVRLIGRYPDSEYKRLRRERVKILHKFHQVKGGEDDRLERLWWGAYSKFWWDNRNIGVK